MISAAMNSFYKNENACRRPMEEYHWITSLKLISSCHLVKEFLKNVRVIPGVSLRSLHRLVVAGSKIILIKLAASDTRSCRSKVFLR